MKCLCCGNPMDDICIICGYADKPAVPYAVPEFREMSSSVEKKEPKPKVYPVGKCRCCGREKKLYSDGLCSRCIGYVNGHYGCYHPAHSPEREAALERLKVRMNF